MALDGWYGVDWAGLKARLREAARAQGISLELISTAAHYQPAAQIEQLMKQYMHKRLMEKYGLPRLSLFYM